MEADWLLMNNGPLEPFPSQGLMVVSWRDGFHCASRPYPGLHCPLPWPPSPPALPHITHASEHKWAFSKAPSHALQKKHLLSTSVVSTALSSGPRTVGGKKKKQTKPPGLGKLTILKQCDIKPEAWSALPSHWRLPVAVTNFANFTAGLTMIWRQITTFHTCAKD